VSHRLPILKSFFLKTNPLLVWFVLAEGVSEMFVPLVYASSSSTSEPSPVKCSQPYNATLISTSGSVVLAQSEPVTSQPPQLLISSPPTASVARQNHSVQVRSPYTATHQASSRLPSAATKEQSATPIAVNLTAPR